MEIVDRASLVWRMEAFQKSWKNWSLPWTFVTWPRMAIFQKIPGFIVFLTCMLRPVGRLLDTFVASNSQTFAGRQRCRPWKVHLSGLEMVGNPGSFQDAATEAASCFFDLRSRKIGLHWIWRISLARHLAGSTPTWRLKCKVEVWRLWKIVVQVVLVIHFIIYLGGILSIRYDHFGQPQTSILGAFFQVIPIQSPNGFPKGLKRGHSSTKMIQTHRQRCFQGCINIYMIIHVHNIHNIIYNIYIT